MRLPLLFLSLAAAAAQAPQPAPPPPMAAAHDLGANLFASSGAVGMVVVVVRGREPFFEGYGETAPGSGVAPSQSSVLRLCSITKIFTTDLLTKLVKQGTVRLDDPLQRFAPRHAVVPRRVEEITLEHLATHTAGLPRELGARPRSTPPFAFPGFATRWQWLPAQKLAAIPGTAALYSNIGFDLLGDALASAAHTPYAKLLAEQTLNPLGMTETTFFPDARQCGRLLRPSRDEGACAVTAATEGSAGLYSTAADMEIWLEYLLGTGAPKVPAQDAAAQLVYLDPARLLRQAGLDHAGKPTGIGLGWMHLMPAGSASHIVEKTGGGAGFSSYIALVPARRTGIFVAFAEGGGWKRNVFVEANDMLLTLAGLPPDAGEPASRSSASKSRPRHMRRRHSA